MIATLKGDMARENAALGIFITLEPPTNPMVQEAIAADFYEPESLTGNPYPKVQILTIEQLFDGQAPAYPRFAAPQTFARRLAADDVRACNRNWMADPAQPAPLRTTPSNAISSAAIRPNPQ